MGTRLFPKEAQARIQTLNAGLHDTSSGFWHLAPFRDYSPIDGEVFAAWKDGDLDEVRRLWDGMFSADAARTFWENAQAKMSAGVPYTRVQVLDPASLSDPHSYFAYTAFLLSHNNVVKGEAVYVLPASKVRLPESKDGTVFDVGFFDGEVVVYTEYERLGGGGVGKIAARTFYDDPGQVADLTRTIYEPVQAQLKSAPRLRGGVEDIAGINAELKRCLSGRETPLLDR